MVIDLVIVFCALSVMTPGPPGEEASHRTWITSPLLAEFRALLKLVSLQVPMMMVACGASGSARTIACVANSMVNTATPDRTNTATKAVAWRMDYPPGMTFVVCSFQYTTPSRERLVR